MVAVYYKDNEGNETQVMKEVNGDSSSGLNYHKITLNEDSVTKLIHKMMRKVSKKKNRLVKPSKFDVSEIASKMLFHANLPYAKSITIAKYFGMRHDNLIRKIEEFYSFDEMIGSSKLRSQTYIKIGKKYKYYELDADAFAFVCLSLTGEKAEKFKWGFIEAFKISTREALKNKIRAEIHLEDEEFMQIRNEGKVVRYDLTEAVKMMCDDAESTRGEKYKRVCPYYRHFTDLVYKYLGLEKPSGNVHRRDVFSKSQLKAIEELEVEVAEAIIVMLNDFEEYHEIYRYIKQELDLS